MASDAVSLDRVSRVVGWKLTKGFYNTVGPNLPQRVAILGEANDANQTYLSTLTSPVQITSAAQAGTLFGFGSPIHMIARILFPVNGDGVGSIPVWVYPQTKAVGATTKVARVQISGVATANVTHYVNVAGRSGIDGVFYAVNISSGDTASQILTKLENAVSAVLSSPVSANGDSYEAILTTKWSGLSANDLTVSVDTNGNAAGLTYTVNYPQAGSGTPSIATALTQFGNDWNTLVLNSYGLEATSIASLMSTNGIPDPTTPTGRFAAIIAKPFIAICGSTSDDPSSTTDSYKADVTIAVAPAPGSPGMPFEAAANMLYLAALQFQNSPNTDVAGQYYPDMPASTTWSSATMALYVNRDTIVKKGCSTVNQTSLGWRVEDFVTTYHPDGETPPQYRYCRNLNIDNNVHFGYHTLELAYVSGHSISPDGASVTADKVIKPKEWKAVLTDYAKDLEARALSADASFMSASIAVNIGTTNPDRFETFFRYKRTGFARIQSTTAEAGFYFGS